jgi:hypothetical protein
MKLEMISVLLSFLLLGCVGMSAFVITPTTTPTTKTSTPFPTPHWTDHPTVQITGDVYVRDDQGKVMGWLNKGDEAPAACSGDWCQIVSGRYSGYHFWRGCSSDNPDRKSCQAR